MRARLGAQRHPIQRRDGLAHGDADHLYASAETRIGHRGKDAPRRTCTDPVGPARARVGLVDDDGHHAPPRCATARGQVGGQGDVTAEADHDVGTHLVEDRPRLTDRGTDPQREPDQVAGRFAGKRDGGDELQVVPALGHQPRLKAARRTERGDPHLRVERDESVGNGHRGLYVSCGASAGEDHGHDSPVATILPAGDRTARETRVAHP